MVEESHRILHHGLQGLEFSFGFCNIEAGLVMY
jgi:hypothetical protein